MNQSKVKEFSSLIDTDMSPEHWSIVEKWLIRGDGVAVYENQALDSSGLGHRKYVSFGSSKAQFEVARAEDLPHILPDIGNEINWRYVLVGVYRR